MDGLNFLKISKKLFFAGGFLFAISAIMFLGYSQDQNFTGTSDTSALTAPANQDPQFDTVYKEIKLKWPSNNRSWRVTNPNAKREEAKAFLPNPVLNTDNLQYVSEPFTLSSQDLDNDVEKIELMIDRWGGHSGTKDEKVRINGKNWYPLPDIQTLPTENRNQYLHHDHPIVSISKADLVPGNNTLEGTTSHQAASGWGQWGWTSVVVRIYYKEGTRAAAKGSVVVDNTLNENPELKVQISSPAGVTATRVDYVAYHEGVDEDGDGYTTDWHEAYFSPKQFQGEGSFEIYGHAGTSFAGGMFPRVWNTRYVPDQSPNSIKIFARIKSSNGLSYITPVRSGLSLNRPNSSVKIFHAQNIPTSWASRKNKINDLVRVRIPQNTNINNVNDSAMFWRTWNGKDYQWGYNSYTTNFKAVNHGFHQSYYEVPTSALVKGNASDSGKVWIRANTEDHAMEGIWPGPSLIIRTGNTWPTVNPDTVTPTPSPTSTLEATLTPTPTVDNSPTPEFTPTPTATPLVVSDTPTPTPTNNAGPDSIVCGAADVTGDERFTISDLIAFASVYLRKCNDTHVDYGVCGGKDVDRNGEIGLSDFRSFGLRYNPRPSCTLYQLTEQT